MNLFGISVGWPWGLIGLAVIPLLVLATIRSQAQLTRPILLGSLATRIIAVIVLVLAICDARIGWPTKDLAVATVIDSSASVTDVERATLAQRVQAVATGNDNVRWSWVAPDPDRARTDLESQVSTAIATMPPDRVRRILLATDGHETVGDVMAAADRARRAGAEVDVIAMGETPSVDQVAVQGLDVPRLVRAGQPLTIAVRLFAANQRTVDLALTLDHNQVATRTVTAARGTSMHELQLTFPDEGVHQLELRATPDVDQIRENNVWRSLVRVVAPPRVLLVHNLAGGEPALATVYRDAKLKVDVVRPQEMPNDTRTYDRYQLVALSELDYAQLREDQMRALRSWVEDMGGGLVTVTGDHPVRREPDILREIEPIRPPRAIPEPRPLELILVIDRSGSMQGAGIMGARNAATAALHALRPDARIGVVAFSGGADAVMTPTPMDRSEDVGRFIGRLYANGGTDIAAAINAANRIASADPRYLHHVILLSDGESDEGPAIAAAQSLAGRGVSISAITLGSPNHLMSEIARIGRGRYHATQSASSLPALFLREAQYRMPPPHREVSFRPSVVRSMSFLDGVSFATDPPLGGYTLADIKPGAQTVLNTPDAGPLLAHWFQGLGQVVSWTSASDDHWADAWRTGAGYRRLFSQMAWEIMRQKNEEQLSVYVDRDAHRPGMRTVSVVAANVRMEPVPIATISRSATDSIPLELTPRAPGVWAADVPVNAGFVVDARMPIDVEPTVAAAVDHPFADELAAFGPDHATLAAIADAGGGRIIARPEAILENVKSVRVLHATRLPLLLLALLLYLLGVLLVRMPSRPPAATVLPGRLSRPSIPPRSSSPPNQIAA